MVRRIAAIAIAVACAAVLTMTPAHASCALDPNETFQDRIDQAVTAFVGRVTKTANQDRTAIVRVLEVWRDGELLAQRDVPIDVSMIGTPLVEEHGGTIDPNGFTSVDRRYTTGQTLLVLPTEGSRTDDQITFTESSCSATTEFTTDVATYRPVGVRPAATTTPDVRVRPPAGNSSSPLVGAVVAAAALLGGIAILRRGRFAGS